MDLRRKKWGDRRDGTLIKDLDGLHFVMPIIYPGRCDNEAYIPLKLDLTHVSEYLDKKNADDPEFRYTLFQLIVTAALKVFTLRPRMNRFIQNKNYYQRNDVSAGFVVKRKFADDGAEGAALLHAVPEDTLFTIRDKMYEQIHATRSGSGDASSNAADMLQKLPRFVGKGIVEALNIMDRHGLAPQSMIDTDPYQASVMFTNLGSIGLDIGYHHLTNWGTNSCFIVIGERGMQPFFHKDGTITMKDSVRIGLTVDERIADGYYFSKTVKLLKKLIEEPELLEEALNKEVEI